MKRPVRGHFRFAAAVAVGLAAWLPAAQGETRTEALSRASALEEEGRYAESVRALEPFAASADGELAFRLAQAHLFAAMSDVDADDAARMDVSEARKWIHRAIELGNPAAYQLLYTIHRHGFGVTADMDTAVEFLQLGVAGGDPGARLDFAILSYYGVDPVAEDLNLAARMFQELADADPANIVASYYVGVMQYRGQGGIPADEKAGLARIEAAALQGVTDAEQDMGDALEQGWAGRAVDVPKALEWYDKAARKGNGYAHWRIGVAYAEGGAVAKDPGRAVDHFRQAAEAGDHNGMTSLGVMYATGDGVPRDFAQARHWYEQAIENGDQHALKNLAYMYTEGQGVAVDLVRAWVLAKQAQQAGIEQADWLVDRIESRISPRDLEKARLQLPAGDPP